MNLKTRQRIQHCIRRQWQLTLERVWPQYCYFCGNRTRNTYNVCTACSNDLPWNHHACRICQFPLQYYQTGVCGHCAQCLPDFNQALAPFCYQRPLSTYLNQLKQAQQLHHAWFLAHCIRQCFDQSTHSKPNALIPIPLHLKKYQQRGYNQATLLAQALGAQLSVSVDNELLRKVKNTRDQKTRSKKQRRHNLKNTFHVGATDYQHVALIDDVMTTGATLNEAARCLKKAGVKRVSAWVVARA